MFFVKFFSWVMNFYFAKTILIAFARYIINNFIYIWQLVNVDKE